MKILIVSQYFWPEDFRINDIAVGLKNAGHEVDVLTGVPNYPSGKIFEEYKKNKKKYKKLQGINIYRAPMVSRGKGFLRLALNYFSFMVGGSLRIIPLLLRKYDRVFIFQLSPITLALPGILISKFKNIKSIMYVQDLWPESLYSIKEIKHNCIRNILSKFCCLIYKSQDKLLITSVGFREKLVEKGVDIKKITYFPQWAEDFYSTEFKIVSNERPFRLTFAGNIGKAQNVDVIVEAAKYIENNHKEVNLEWQIIGDGSEYEELRNLTNEYELNNKVKFLGRKPSIEMPKYLNDSDVLLVTLGDDEVLNITLPAKVQSYMATGKPLIGAINGEGKRIINESKCGLVGNSGDFKALAKNALDIYYMTEEERKYMGENGKRFFEENFTRKKLLSELEIIVNS